MHCLVRKQQGLGRDSLVLPEQIRTIGAACASISGRWRAKL
jgi:hypothetical protein